MKRILIAPVRFYQRFISPAFPPSCRFEPTCSNYMIQAIEKTWLQGCHYGFYCHKNVHPKLYKYLHDCFAAIRDNTGLKANQWWIGWRNFDKDYRNWDSEVLVKITTGELANYIFEHWKPLLEFFNSHLSEIKRIVN